MANEIKLTVQEICDILEIKLPAEYASLANETVTNITSVVNSLAPGGVFILYGKNAEERERLLKRALSEKPKLVLAGKASRSLPQLQEVPHAFVKDGYGSVVRLSAAFREKLGLTVVGVTGSLGKTSTKELLHAVLSQQYVADKNFGNRNNTTGIFLSMQEIKNDVEYYVQEYGVAIGSRSMESKIQACVPNAAVITNISDPHVEILGSRENILKEKIKLVTEMADGAPAFLNYDDPLLKQVVLKKHPIISYAVENKSADYYAENIQVFDGYMEFEVVHGQRRTPVKLNSVGVHNVGNAVVAMAVGEWAGVPMDKIVQGIATYKSEGIRQSLTDIGGYKLYIDSYNAAPVSMIGAVETVARLPVKEGGKRIAVVAEMLELGDRSPALHTEVGEKIGRSNMDLVICYGKENARRIAEAARKLDKATLYTPDREELNSWLRSLITRKDIALFKGSHGLLLHKSIDQVFGTSFHLGDDYYMAKEGDFKYKVAHESDTTKRMVAIAKYLGAATKLVLPGSYDGVAVYSVESKSFLGNRKLKEVTVSAPVTNIAEEAFCGCASLAQVSFPETLKLIETKAFSGCAALKEIVIPEGVIEIAEEAFANCTGLERVVLPASLGRIGEGAFTGCGNAKFECVAGSYAEAYISEHK